MDSLKYPNEVLCEVSAEKEIFLPFNFERAYRRSGCAFGAWETRKASSMDT